MYDLFNPPPIPIHRIENNPESMENLAILERRFSAQCQKVYDLLNSGVRLTSLEAITKYRIGHLARRIKDLKQAGILVKDTWIERDNSRFKEYYL